MMTRMLVPGLFLAIVVPMYGAIPPADVELPSVAASGWKVEPDLPQGDKPRLLLLGIEGSKDEIIIETQYAPEIGARSIVECVFGQSSWAVVPAVAQFQLELHTNGSLKQVDIAHFSLDQSTRTVHPAIYELSFPVEATRKLQTPSLLCFRIPFRSLGLSGEGTTVDDRRMELALIFTEVHCAEDGQRLSKRCLRSDNIVIDKDKDGHWRILSPKLFLPLTICVQKDDSTG